MDKMEDPIYYSGEFYVRVLGYEDMEVKHFFHLMSRLKVYWDSVDDDDDEPCVPADLANEFITLGHKLHYRAVIKYKEQMN